MNSNDDINTTQHNRNKYQTGLALSDTPRLYPLGLVEKQEYAQYVEISKFAQKAQGKPKFGKHLPTDAQERKAIPLYSGVLNYFPDALVEVAKLSKAGNDQHNGKDSPLHWAREKSTDQEDTLIRHLLEAGTVDSDGMLHSTKVAWRALARLQLEIEERRANGLSETKAV